MDHSHDHNEWYGIYIDSYFSRLKKHLKESRSFGELNWDEAFDPHARDAEPLLQSIHVCEDIFAATRSIKRDDCRHVMDLFRNIPCRCLCIDDEIEEVQNLLNNDSDLKDCLKGFEFTYIRYDSKVGTAVNIRRIEKEVRAHEARYPEDLLVFLMDVNLAADPPYGSHGHSGSADGRRLGMNLVSELQTLWPHIPIFALTKYRDHSMVLHLGRRGVDAFVYKKSLALLPLYLATFHLERLGRLVLQPSLHSAGKGLSRESLGIVRKHLLHWQRRIPQSLWYGDRVPILVDHGMHHSRNLWELTASLYEAAPGALGAILKVGEDGDLLPAFLLALWLHDIGHKGDDKVQEPPAVRKAHGAISARLLCRRPDLYLPHLPRPADHHRLVEYLMAFCRYHISHSPLDEESFEKNRREGRLTDDFLVGAVPLLQDGDGGFLPPSLPMIIREDPVTHQRYLLLAPELRPAVCLFRFLDCLDHRSNRVGQTLYREMKLDAMRQEMAWVMPKAVQSGQRLERELLTTRPECRKESVKLHKVLQKVHQAMKDILATHQTLCRKRASLPRGIWNHPALTLGLCFIMERQKKDLEKLLQDLLSIEASPQDPLIPRLPSYADWRTLVDYFILLSIQEVYYHLHAAFREVRFEKRDHEPTTLNVVHVLDSVEPDEAAAGLLFAAHTAYFCSLVMEYADKEWRVCEKYLRANIQGIHMQFVLERSEGSKRLEFPLNGEVNEEQIRQKVLQEMLKECPADKPMELSFEMPTPKGSKEEKFAIQRESIREDLERIARFFIA